MKFVYAVILVLLVNLTNAQQSFQGTIVYNLHADTEKDDAELTIHFGVNKIKISFTDKKDNGNAYLLIDLDSGKFFSVDSSHKTYRSRKLIEISTNDPAPTPKTIAGYATDPVTASGNGLTIFLGGVFPGKMTYYVAKDLSYPVPAKYAATPELMMISNNRIVLGLTIVTFSKDRTDSANQMTITIEAKKIEKNSFDASVFTIPADYKKFDQSNWAVMDSTGTDSVAIMADSTVMMDTMAIATPKKSQLKPKTKPAAPKKTPTKSEAIKPKKTKTRP